MAVRANVHVGDDFHVGPGSRLWAPHRMQVGNRVYVGKYCTLEFDGIIGDGALIANNVGIVGRTDHDLNQVGRTIALADWVGEYPRLSASTFIGSDVWI